MVPGAKIAQFSLVFLTLICCSCHSAKKLSGPATPASSADSHISKGKSDKNSITSSPTYVQPESQVNNVPGTPINNAFIIDRAIPVQFRYSIVLDTEVENISNTQLYNFIDNWWGTPYRIGGMTQRGVDCSAFTQNLDAAIFNIALPRTAKEQYDACQKISIQDAREGDLVFFNTKGGVSHVGIYLQNNKFVHASSSGGVMISDLNEPYWKKRFLKAGRPVSSMTTGN